MFERAPNTSLMTTQYSDETLIVSRYIFAQMFCWWFYGSLNDIKMKKNFFFYVCWVFKKYFKKLIHYGVNRIEKYNSVYCVKSVRIRSYSGPYFLAFERNTERYSAFLRIQFECGVIRTRKTPNTDTFHTVSAIVASSINTFKLSDYCFIAFLTKLLKDSTKYIQNMELVSEVIWTF